MRDRCVPSINSRTTVSDVGALYEDVPYEQLASFFDTYADLGIDIEFLQCVRIVDLIKGYHDFPGLRDGGINNLTKINDFALTMAGLGYSGLEAVQKIVTKSTNDSPLWNFEFLKHSFFA